jgi:diaminohydroxyphosphoribosylaminopyrimidine deaminase/5-amino-6-(5-phosphoribosylamino)uracil reductase
MPTLNKFSNFDLSMMRRALALARRGSGFVSPNPMVGSVVVRGQEIVGSGWHKTYGGPHAEIEALRESGDEAFGATMYVTLEPCNHHGLTPPCTEAIIGSGLKRVVIAMRDPNPKVAGKGIEKLMDSGIRVDVGLCQQKSEELNVSWIKSISEKRPFVIVKLAISLDGKIARADGSSKWISSTVSRAQVHRLRRHCDAIMVGAETVIVDNPELTNRSGKGRQPLRLVVDDRLRVSQFARVFKPLELNQKGFSPSTTVITTTKAGFGERSELEMAGAEIMVYEDQNGEIDFKTAFQKLSERGIQSILCEGGASLATSLVKSGLCDRLMLYVAPCLIGHAGRNFLDMSRLGDDWQLATNYKLSFVRKVAGDTLMCLERNNF